MKVTSSTIATDVKSKKRSSAVSQKRNYENRLLQHQVMTFYITISNSGPGQFLSGTTVCVGQQIPEKREKGKSTKGKQRHHTSHIT
jgi:hypothetical protein